MEPSKPNSLIQALAAQKPAGEHPDADVLNAFAERSLLEREREVVMAHLAACAECRDVLSLAGTAQEVEPELELVAAAAPVPAAAPMATSRAIVVPLSRDRVLQAKRRVWLPLAAAACLAIVSVVAVRYGQRKHERMAVVREQAAPVSPQGASESSKTVANAPPVAPVPGVATEQAQGEMKQSQKADAKGKASFASVPEKKALAGLAESHGLVATSKPAIAPETTQDALAATNQAVVREEQQVAAEASRDVSVRKDEQQAQSMQMHLPAAAPRATAPSLDGAFAKTANAGFVAKPQWRINPQGHLERQLGTGPWQAVLPSEQSKMHVVSVVGGTVWAGGENDVLYRSRDEGATWQKIPLPEKNGLPHVIANIRFENATTGTVEAEDGMSWTTTDGGATWK